jgi:hypothetical protein
MAFRVRVRIKGQVGTRVVIEEGTIFEVADLDAASPQTLRVTAPHVFTIGPEPAEIFVGAECLNPTRPAPRNTPMRGTPFVRP